ncbi:MAG: YDG domain-containing protein, partial [Verrucomicrobiota bacterium]
ATNRPVSVASNVVAVAAGYAHSLFVKADGTLWAMGANEYGQLGNGSPSATNRPVSVTSNVVAVAAGNTHSLFVKADGTLWAMGNNGNGQLGNGSTSATNLPVSVASNVVAVAAGNYHSLFMKADGTLWAMGNNGNGQLGNGSNSDTNRPVSVASNVVAVAAGNSHSLLVKADGTLWAMGYNVDGELGNGSNRDTNRPVSVASNVVAVAAGGSHSLLVKADGTLWAMGFNYYGQLGGGSNRDTNRPVNVVGFSVASLGALDTAFHSLAVAVMTKSPATVTLTSLAQTYDATAKPVSVATSPTNLAVSVTYSGSANAPTIVGSYTVVGTITDPDYYGSATTTLVIAPAAATVTLGNLSQIYDGTAKSVSVTTDPTNLAVSVTYNGNAGAPTNTGSYSVIAIVTDANYRGTNTATGQITAKALAVTAPTIAAKVYDSRRTSGAVTVGIITGEVPGETVTATAVVADYASANVGWYSNVVVTYTLVDGTGWATNYSLANGTATGQTTPKALAVTAPAIAAKGYDGTATAGALTVGTLSGLVGSETVTATGAVANYASANVGTYPGIDITYTLHNGTGGGWAGNYSLANGTASGQVTPKALAVTAPAIAAKGYDATVTAGAVTAGTLVGLVGSETVTATGAAANYASANVGTYPGVDITYTLHNGTGGGWSGNYSLANGTATGQITLRALTVAGILARDKVYDGTTNATLILTQAALAGNLDGTNVVLSTTNATGAFADPHVGTNKTVWVSGLTLSGSATNNYAFTPPTT